MKTIINENEFFIVSCRDYAAVNKIFSIIISKGMNNRKNFKYIKTK